MSAIAVVLVVLGAGLIHADEVGLPQQRKVFSSIKNILMVFGQLATLGSSLSV